MNKSEPIIRYSNLDVMDNNKNYKEEYAAYRTRLKENYYKVKYYLKGELFWDSLSKGTYRIRK